MTPMMNASHPLEMSAGDEQGDDADRNGQQPAHGVRPRMEKPTKRADDRSYDDEPDEVHGAVDSARPRKETSGSSRFG